MRSGTARLLRLQQLAGNSAVTGVIQREPAHEEGSGVSGVPELGGPGATLDLHQPLPARNRFTDFVRSVGRFFGIGGGGGGRPQAPPQQAEPAQDQAQHGQAQQGQAQAQADAGPQQLPPQPTPNYIDAAAAQRVLTDAFGTVKQIVQGTIRIEPTQQDILAAYDRICVAHNVTNPVTHQPWVTGDAAHVYPGGLDGFQDPFSSDVYINGETAGPVTVCHEMLHLNAAHDWRGFAGEKINEGVTEILAQFAVTHARLRITDSPAYVDEQRVANALQDVVGHDRLLQAYLLGGQSITALQTAVDTTCGAGTWAAVRTAAEASNFDEAVRLLGQRAGAAAHPPQQAPPQQAPAAAAVGAGGRT